MVLSLPELTKTLDDPIRAALQCRADHWLNLLMWSTRLVLMGVAVEGIEFAVETGAWIVRQAKRKRERTNLKEVNNVFPAYENSPKEHKEFRLPKWVKFVAFTGLVLVVVGVAGELDFEYKLEAANGAIQSLDNDRLTAARKEAGDAATSATTAHNEADAVKNGTDALTLRLSTASSKLDDIEQTTLAQGPRWRLLKRGEDGFIKALRPFAGQRVTVVMCGNGDVERTGLEQLIINMFREAGWNSPEYKRWVGCPNMLTGGNEIYFVAATDDSAEWADMPAQQWLKPECGRFNTSHDAVNTLRDVLYKLRIFTSAWREKPIPEEVGILYARQFFGLNAPDGPAELAYKDPGRIFLLVGPNAPMFADEDKHPHKSARPR